MDPFWDADRRLHPHEEGGQGEYFPILYGAVYYVTAAITHGVYGRSFIIGWTVFALVSPVLAYFAWMTKKRGVFPKIIAAGIVAVSVMSSNHLRIHDVIIDGVLIYILFSRRRTRTNESKTSSQISDLRRAFGAV